MRNFLFFVIALSISCSEKPDLPNSSSTVLSPRDQYIEKQVAKQYQKQSSLAKKDLDFSPFKESLSQLNSENQKKLAQKLEKITILDIQKLFSQKLLSSEELTLHFLYQIQKYDSNKLNSILELNPEALEIAKRCDKERKEGQAPSLLHGIPVLLKDNIASGDSLHNTAGAKALENAQADQDAFLVQSLRESGAIIIGKANLTEWANFMSYGAANGFSTLGGQNKNPYGKFDVGGSSSGSASAVSANLVTVAIGTETAGSIIYPSSQNSVVGLKPSLGLVSRNRIIPITSAQDTAGPIARNVTDLSILLNAMTKPDPNDSETPLTKDPVDYTKYLNLDGLQGKTIGLVTGFEEKLRAEDKEIQDQIIALLKKAKVSVKEITLPPEAYEIKYYLTFYQAFHHELNDYLQKVAQNTNIHSLEEIVAFNKKNLAIHAPYGQKILEQSLLDQYSLEQFEHYNTINRQKAQKYIDDAIKQNKVDFILTLSNYLSGIYPTAGYPALCLPAGYRKSGEPVGFTLVGGYLDDAKLIEFAYAFEQKYFLRQAPILE